MVHSLLDELPHRRPKATGLTNPGLEIRECEPRENSSLSELIASGICYTQFTTHYPSAHPQETGQTDHSLLLQWDVLQQAARTTYNYIL